jgi:hypothetical protein
MRISEDDVYCLGVVLYIQMVRIPPITATKARNFFCRVRIRRTRIRGSIWILYPPTSISLLFFAIVFT